MTFVYWWLKKDWREKELILFIFSFPFLFWRYQLLIFFFFLLHFYLSSWLVQEVLEASQIGLSFLLGFLKMLLPSFSIGASANWLLNEVNNPTNVAIQGTHLHLFSISWVPSPTISSWKLLAHRITPVFIWMGGVRMQDRELIHIDAANLDPIVFSPPPPPFFIRGGGPTPRGAQGYFWFWA